MTFRRFNIGDKLRPTAAQANAWTNAAIASSKKDSQRNVLTDINSSTRVPVANNTGAVVTAFSVLQLTGSIIDPVVNENEFLNRIAFDGDSVTLTDTEKFAIIQQTINDGIIDPHAIVAGVSFARLTGKLRQTNATPTAGQATLETGSSGPCSILYDPGLDENVERIGVVRIGGGGGGGGSKIIRFQIVSSDPTCLTALCTIKAQSFNGVADDSTLEGQLVTVYDEVGTFFNEPNVDLTGRRGQAVYMIAGPNNTDIDGTSCDPYLDGRWEVFSLGCDTTECFT